MSSSELSRISEVKSSVSTYSGIALNAGSASRPIKSSSARFWVSERELDLRRAEHTALLLGRVG